MPIKGLTESRRMPRLGKIHLGIKKISDKSGKEYPAAVDYFVCPPEVQAVFGEKPKELKIFIPVESEEAWASQFYRCYSRTRGLVCKGDGELAIRMIDTTTGALAWKDDAKTVVMKEVPCQGRECPDYGEKCKEIMNLQFLLPEVPGIGIWQIDTGSINSIRNINSCADLIRRIYGRVAMIPLILAIEPIEVTLPDTGKKKTVWVLNLRTKDTMIELMRLTSKGANQTLLSMADALPDDTELPVPDDETPDLIIPANQEPKKVCFATQTVTAEARQDTEDLYGRKAMKGIEILPVKPARLVDPPPKSAIAPQDVQGTASNKAEEGITVPDQGAAPPAPRKWQNWGEFAGTLPTVKGDPPKTISAGDLFERATLLLGKPIKRYLDFASFEEADGVLAQIKKEKGL